MATQHPYNFQLIKAKEITYNRLYQREMDKALIKHIFNNFDYHEVNPVKVVYHDGAYYAFDGQHTTISLRQKFGDNYLVPCLVYDDVPTWVEEAILFEKINSKKERRPVSTFALWKSKNNRGEDTVTAIRRIVEKNGFALYGSERETSKREIRALDALEAVMKTYGGEKLDEALEIIQRSWHGNEKSIQSKWIRGMTFFVDMYAGEYKKENLINQLCKFDPDKIRKSADELKNQDPPVKTKNDIAFKLAQIYNNYHGSSRLAKLELSKILK